MSATVMRSTADQTAWVSTRVPIELRDAIRLKAEQAERSVSAEIRLALKSWTASQEG